MEENNFKFEDTQVDQENYAGKLSVCCGVRRYLFPPMLCGSPIFIIFIHFPMHDHRGNCHLFDIIPEITDTLLDSTAFPETPAHAAGSTMDCPKTPVRIAAAALAVPTPPVSRVQVTYNSPADDLMPLIIAANDVKFNYKAMAAMDPHGRTVSALEHRVRNFRQAAKALAAAAQEKENGGANDKAGGTIRENGIADGDADKKKNTPARKTPVKASPRGKKAATVKDSELDGQNDSTPSKKPKVTRKRQVKIEGTDESPVVKKRKTIEKGEVEADGDVGKQ